MKKVFVIAAVLALLCLGSLAQADVFNLGPGLTNLETVPVGNPGNQADTELMSDGTTGYGSVGYVYSIGKYEVTAGQYTDFLNKVALTDTYGLYSTNMDNEVFPLGCKIQRTGTSGSYTYSVASDWANRPVNCVSYWDSCRFANWLHNGQPTGLPTAATTERGVYTLDGYNGDDGRTIQRNANWKWAVTSEDEWYKAAYYKSGGTNAGYWDYPTQSNTAPSNVLGNPTDPGNNATYNNDGHTIGSPYYRTEVGAHENSDSPYGTFDQGGNVLEWNEAIVNQDTDYAYRGLRGGAFGTLVGSLQASYRIHLSYPSSANSIGIGFRVSEVVPEPSSVLVLGSGILALAGMIRRRNG